MASKSGKVILPSACSCETSLWVLHWVLGFLAQERHAGVRTEPGLKNNQRAETSLLWRKAEAAGAVQSGEEKAELTEACQYIKGAHKKDGEKLFKRSEVTGQGKEILNWERVD